MQMQMKVQVQVKVQVMVQVQMQMQIQTQIQGLVIVRRGLLRLRRFLAHSKALGELRFMVPSKSPNSKI